MSPSDIKGLGLRRTGAVLAGLFATALLSTGGDIVMHATETFPAMGQPMGSGLWALAVAYRCAFTLLGGWISGRLDPQGSMVSVWILTGLGLCLGLMGVALALSKPELGPLWYAWAVALSGPPASWLGGRSSIPSLMDKETA